MLRGVLNGNKEQRSETVSNDGNQDQRAVNLKYSFKKQRTEKWSDASNPFQFDYKHLCLCDLFRKRYLCGITSSAVIFFPFGDQFDIVAYTFRASFRIQVNEPTWTTTKQRSYLEQITSHFSSWSKKKKKNRRIRDIDIIIYTVIEMIFQ